MVTQLCPICRRHVPKLVNDHDHATGYQREYICGACNSGLGFFRDDAKVMRRAAKYIERHIQLNEELTIHRHLKPSMDAPDWETKQ